jgi:hypothetical protein
MSEALKEKFLLRYQVESMKLDDAKAALEAGDVDLLKIQIERITKAFTQLNNKNDEIVECLMDEEKTIGEIKTWKGCLSTDLNKFTVMKINLEKMYQERLETKLQTDHDRETFILKHKSELQEQLLTRQVKLEQSLSKLNVSRTGEDVDIEVKARPQTVKLQKYTITPFTGDYKDWLRFWNQFSVEVDASGISEISKFNYLLELLKGKPKEDILGLPHNEDGYIEAKRILVETYGKDIKITKSVIKEIENRKFASIERHDN